MKKIFLFLALITLFCSCAHQEEPEIPKPTGYFRIDLPEHEYQTLDTTLPFKFDYSTHALCSFERKEDDAIWLYIKYPDFNADINVSYILLHNDLRDRILAEDKLISNHYKVADDVEYSVICDPENHIFGQIYDLKGKSVACPLSIWMTDSTQNYFRAALYFNHAPNNDSLQPVIDYIREDVLYMIESFSWK
ncbi:MAG: hypothetical protein MJZ76_00500 [Bacteroidales bacterium]|nr:hypothetical protein [Bacteroidales bacterium]